MNDILQHIKILCGKNGITIAELERNLKFSTSSISKWDKVNPTISKVEAVANYFNISIDYLLGRTHMPLTVDQTLSDKDLITIQRLRENLSVKNREKMMQMMRIQFSEDFPEEN